VSKVESERLARAVDIGLKQWFEEERGLELTAGVEQLRDIQVEALEWIASQSCPYLFINAPTGVGKTIINITYGVMSGLPWTYAVSTNLLQEQVANTFSNLPTLRGRRNFPCLIEEVNADEAECVTDSETDCPHKSGEVEGFCAYYGQRDAAFAVPHRTTNYALFLRDHSLRRYDERLGSPRTRLLLADEAHNIEDAVVNAVEITLNRRTAQRFGIKLPELSTIAEWVAWAKITPTPTLRRGSANNVGAMVIGQALTELRGIAPSDEGNWIITPTDWGVKFEPVWGAPYVMSHLFGHTGFANGQLLSGQSGSVERAVMTSATLMGAEYTADTLGLPVGTWAYLDLPSPFAARNRPINFSPVETMNASKIANPAARAPMQAAIDRLIEYYVLNGNPAGIVHAVSNKYRDIILTESRWAGILTKDPVEHASRVERGEASVIVAANLSEGWDGIDSLCRFVIMPKVPFPNLGDRRTSIRKDEDGRSFDHSALVAIVQGAGRGVRHAADTADTWILDGAWSMLYKRRRDWLPEAFMSAYHHKVQLP
jgi:Rad3-related DNA helicase